MVTPADEAERPSISRPDPEDISCSEEPDPPSHPRAAEANLEDGDVSSEQPETPAEPQQDLNEKVAASQDVPQTAEDGRDEDQDSESADGPAEDVSSSQQQRLGITVEDDTLVVKPSAERVKTSGEDSSLQLFFSGVKSDYWRSPSETGATNQPEHGCRPQAGGFDALVWGDLALGPPAAPKKQLLVHSEESEVEAESWSSGEEPV